MRGGTKDCCGRKACALAWAAFYVLAVTAPAGAQKPVVTPEQPSQVENVAGTVVSMDTASRTLVLQPVKTQRPITLTWEDMRPGWAPVRELGRNRRQGVRVDGLSRYRRLAKGKIGPWWYMYRDEYYARLLEVRRAGDWMGCLAERCLVPDSTDGC